MNEATAELALIKESRARALSLLAYLGHRDTFKLCGVDNALKDRIISAIDAYQDGKNLGHWYGPTRGALDDYNDLHGDVSMTCVLEKAANEAVEEVDEKTFYVERHADSVQIRYVVGTYFKKMQRQNRILSIDHRLTLRNGPNKKIVTVGWPGPGGGGWAEFDPNEPEFFDKLKTRAIDILKQNMKKPRS